MTPEAQRIAIAEACGHKNVRAVAAIPHLGVARYLESDTCVLPDYLSDLNAMHEAENILSDKDGALIGTGDGQCRSYAIELVGRFNLSRFGLAHATAAQRAEAFLRTIGKWEDGK